MLWRAMPVTVATTVTASEVAKATPITRVAVSASLDGGKTWHPARVTGSGTSYAAAYNPRPGPW